MSNYVLGGFLLGAVVIAGLFTKKASADESKTMVGFKTPYEDLFKKYGKQYGVPWQILSGVAYTESNYNSIAVNTTDNESLGLMQVLCRPDGSGGCINKFPAVNGWENIKRNDLLQAERNIEIASQILADNIKQFGMPRAIAVYNAWDARFYPKDGPFKNNAYVKKVLNRAKELGYEA